MSWARFEYIADSKEVTLIGTLHDDILNTTRLFPPQTDIKILIERSSPEFALVRGRNGNETYNIRWIDARMSVTRVHVNDNIRQGLVRTLNSRRDAYFPFTRTDSRTFEIPKGSRNYNARMLFSGALPDRVVLVLCDPDSLGYGSWENNPMLFPAKKFDLNFVQFYIDETRVLEKPFRPDWNRDQYAKEYMALLQATGVDRNLSLSGGSISYKQFSQDYGVFCTVVRGVDGRETGSVFCGVGIFKRY